MEINIGNHVISGTISITTILALIKYVNNLIDKKFKESEKRITKDLKESVKSLNDVLQEFKKLVALLEDLKYKNNSEKFEYLSKIDNLINEIKIIGNDVDNTSKNNNRIYDYIEKIKDYTAEVNNYIKLDLMSKKE